MNTKIRSNSVVTTELEGNELRFTVVGKDTKAIGTVALDLTKVHNDIKARAVVHGLKQRITDATAMSRVLVNGVETNATPQAKLEAMRQLVEHYNSGAAEWRIKGQGERIGSDEVLLVRALGEVYPEKDVDKLRAYVAGLTKAQRTALLGNEKIKATAERLRAETTADVNTEELLEGLDAI